MWSFPNQCELIHLYSSGISDALCHLVTVRTWDKLVVVLIPRWLASIGSQRKQLVCWSILKEKNQGVTEQRVAVDGVGMTAKPQILRWALPRTTTKKRCQCPKICPCHGTWSGPITVHICFPVSNNAKTKLSSKVFKNCNIYRYNPMSNGLRANHNIFITSLAVGRFAGLLDQHHSIAFQWVSCM